MSDAEASVSKRRRISMIWAVPIAALLLGLYMVFYTLQSQGPLVTIVFATAQGIEAGKTKIRALNVEVGIVESASIAKDLEHVVVTARLDKKAKPLLREDTQFWVVRPRVGATGISGLGTALSGAYIQLEPGEKTEGRRHFLGLEEPPVTPVGTPGLRFELVSERGGSVRTGNPILYKGFRVGRIEKAEFDLDTKQMRYGGFIKAPYDELVTSSTRFWNVSGISIKGSAAGIEVETRSLEAMLFGGVALGLPEGVHPGKPVSHGTSFRLYRNYDKVNEHPYRTAINYVVFPKQSIRGLVPGAPVEYRGVRIGRVERVLLEELTELGLEGTGSDIPVLIRLEPGRLELRDNEEGAEGLTKAVLSGVQNGMRASLRTGNLLTGSLYVELDFFPDEPAIDELGTFADYATIPSVASGLEGIQQKVATLLDNINALPLDQTVASANQMISSLDTLIASQEMQELPATLEATLVELQSVLDSLSEDSALQTRVLRTTVELDRSLQSLRKLLDTLEEQPNALIFKRRPKEDPTPPSGTP